MFNPYFVQKCMYFQIYPRDVNLLRIDFKGNFQLDQTTQNLVQVENISQSYQSAQQQSTSESNQNLSGIPINYCFYSPTIKPSKDVYIQGDINVLKKSYDGIGCDWKTCLNLITHRIHEHRQALCTAYLHKYKECLMKRTAYEFTGTAEFVACCLLNTNEELDCYIIRRATKGCGMDNVMVNYILCTRSYCQIEKINCCYKEKYGENLLDVISSEKSGSYCRFLTSLVQRKRSCDEVDVELARRQAATFYTRDNYDDEQKKSIIDILTGCSYLQINQIIKEFEVQYGNLFNECFGNTEFEVLMKCIIKFANDPLKYLSEFLLESIKNKNIKHVALFVITRFETDLGVIIKNMQEQFGCYLVEELQKAFKGNEKELQCLFWLLGH